MNKVTTINLNGSAYQLEESGYEALRAYLDNAARRLEGNPDRDEIIADIEQAIADKFRVLLGAYKNVVTAKEVETVVTEMGPVQDASDSPGAGASDAAGKPGASAGPKAAGAESASAAGAKRLYKIKEGAKISGVCNGLAAYFNIDVTIVRILFVILTVISHGFGVLAYLLLMFIVPTARTPEQMASATGAAATAQDFIRRAKEGYYEGMKTFGDKQAHREWKRKFKQEMRGWKRDFKRQMHEHAFQWQQNWAPRPQPCGGSWIPRIFLSLLIGLLAFLTVIAAIVLLVTGAIFGLLLPVGIPLWVGLILLFVGYQILVWPLKAMRRACYWHGAYDPCGSGPGDAFVWAGLFVLFIWLADRYVPQTHEILQYLLLLLHHAAHSVREWWATH